MSYLSKYQNNIRREIPLIPKLIFDLFILNAGNIATEVRRRWIIGEGIDGGIIGEYRSSEYQAFKAEANPLASGSVDLTLTGSLGENITIREVGQSRFEIYSTDEKYTKIGEEYGFEQFGLNEQQEAELINELFTFAYESIFNKIWRA